MTTTAALVASPVRAVRLERAHRLHLALLAAVLVGVLLLLVLVATLAAPSGTVPPVDGPRPSPSAQAPPAPPS